MPSGIGQHLVFEVEGWDKLWSLRNGLVIPLNFGKPKALIGVFTIAVFLIQ